jgi:putrescine transport system permease protein
MSARRTAGRRGRWLVAGIPLLWLGVFFLLPMLILLRISFSEALPGARPPYGALLDWSGEGWPALRATLENYGLLWRESIYLAAFLGSLRIAALATLLALLIGYPMAYGIARAAPAWRLPLLLLVMLPFWTSFLIRTYAWIGLLNGNGTVNQILLALGLIEQPLPLLHNDFAVLVGIVYAYLPFMVLPLAAVLMRMDRSLVEAAADLGCTPAQAFWRVTLPLSVPGIVAGSLLVFIPALGEFVIPDLLGGPDTLMLGKLLWAEFFHSRDWPLAAALAVVLLLLVVLPVLAFERLRRRGADAGERP